MSLRSLGAAEGLRDALIRQGRQSVALEARAVVEGVGDDVQQLLKRPEVLVRDGGVECGLHQVVARDEGGVDQAHGRAALLPGDVFLLQATTPVRGPSVIGGGIGEERSHVTIGRGVRGGAAQGAKGEGKVGVAGCHALQQVFCEGDVSGVLR